ncbi:GTP-binding protein [Paraclostridium bifermentans]|uniref:GTP-binding protein n=1 Tax=Paraclostridium bifermentans TaxID=1490 RepID=UPI0011DE2CC1|nr:GTP-binding protein [Paraclostridium bifermentans]MDU3803341.1 GTP-binding protein [Paraclostridium bifermentans]
MIKIDIVSGFLGSGKTTLIKKMLNDNKNEKVVVLENEFGQIGIDGELIKKDGLEVIELQNGCICCSIKLNFKNTIEEILEKLNPDRIIIEPTGVGLLSEILIMLNDKKLKKYLKLNSIITVVDGVNYFDYIDNFGEFYEDQIKNAKTIIISKSQLIDHESLNSVINSLKNINENSYIIYEDWNSEEFYEAIKNINELAHFSDEDIKKIKIKDISESMKEISSIALMPIKTYSIKDIEKIFGILETESLGKIIRCKGFVNSGNSLLEFNYVNGKYDIKKSCLKICPKLCIIGTELKFEELKKTFI